MNRLENVFHSLSYHTALCHALALESSLERLVRLCRNLQFSTITLERIGENGRKGRRWCWRELYCLCTTGLCCDSWASTQSGDRSVCLFISLWLIDTSCLCSVISLLALISPVHFCLFCEPSNQQTIVWEYRLKKTLQCFLMPNKTPFLCFTSSTHLTGLFRTPF